MRLYWLKLTIMLILFCGPFNAKPARSLPIFNSTLTEIICSAVLPVFRLVTEDGMEYDEEHYSQLPGLFDIKAVPVVSPDGNNVTLFINGTNRSSNVTVICGDFRNVQNVVLGQTETLFTLVLDFFNALPAPDNVSYTTQGPGRQLQVMWQPPTLFTSETENVSVDSKITHYIVSITSEETANISIVETPETSLSLELDNESCRFSFQVAAVNPAGSGEQSHPNSINWCTSSTTFTAVAKSSPASRTKILSDSEIAAIAICTCVPVAIAIALSVATAFMYAKIKSGRSTQNLKSDLSHEVSNPKDIVPEKEKEKGNNINMEGERSRTDIHADDIVDEQEREADSASTQRERCNSHDGPPDGLYYAEINVLTKKKNRVPEPSSEDIGHHVYAVLEKPTNATTDQNVEPDTDHPASDSQN